MGLFDQLGGFVSPWSFVSNPQAMLGALSQSNYAQTWQFRDDLMTPHGSLQDRCIHTDCPICKENIEKVNKVNEELKVIFDKRKQDYEKRCKEYMKRFRKLYESKNT